MEFQAYTGEQCDNFCGQFLFFVKKICIVVAMCDLWHNIDHVSPSLTAADGNLF